MRGALRRALPPPDTHQAVRIEFYLSIANTLRSARSKAYQAVNSAMVEAYWNIGRMTLPRPGNTMGLRWMS
jgi:hypothetical protein